MSGIGDVDIDCRPFDPLTVFKTAVKASTIREGKLVPHPCGVYFQDVPVDPLTGLAAVLYEDAEILGCFKVDFLHLHIYSHFSSHDEIKQLLKFEPDWNLLKIPSVVVQLFQLGKHYEILQQVKPRSVQELADVLALIRPQKIYILPSYLEDRERARSFLYRIDERSGYAFKKAHAISYALVIVLQLHLMQGGITF